MTEPEPLFRPYEASHVQAIKPFSHYHIEAWLNYLEFPDGWAWH